MLQQLELPISKGLKLSELLLTTPNTEFEEQAGKDATQVLFTATKEWVTFEYNRTSNICTIVYPNTLVLAIQFTMMHPEYKEVQ